MRPSSFTTGREVPTRVALAFLKDPQRFAIERFIHDHFAAVYGAKIHAFLPVLMSLQDSSGAMQGALGLRPAASGPLFLEGYLAEPVETRLQAVTNRPWTRDRIIEVGNLAVGNPGGGRWLITALTALLNAAGQDWAVFTCGPRLRNAFRRLGIALVDLGEASLDAIPPQDQSAWGSYYDQHPRVMAAAVVASSQAIVEVLTQDLALSALWQQAYGVESHQFGPSRYASVA